MNIIPLDELKVGQSGKLLDEIPYDLWDELTEGYEQEVVDWVNKVFVKGSVYGDDRVYAVIPKGTIIKLLTTHGPGAGWPMYEINGEEVDMSGDLDEYRVILLDGSETSKYGYFVANDEIDEARLPEVIDTYNLDGFDVIRGNYLMKGTAENLHKFVSEELGVKGTLQEFVDAADKSFSKVRTVKDSKSVKDDYLVKKTGAHYPLCYRDLEVVYHDEEGNEKSTVLKEYCINVQEELAEKAIEKISERHEYQGRFDWENDDRFDDELLEYFKEGAADKAAQDIEEGKIKVEDSKSVKDTLPKYDDDLADKIFDILDELDIDFDGDIENGIAIPKSKLKIFEGKLDELGIDYKEYDEDRSSRKYQGISFFDSKTVKDVKPRKGESKEDFISRFMEETKEEYPDQKQRLAVAYSYWERKNKKSTKDSLDNANYYVLESKDGLFKYKNKLVLFETKLDALNYANNNKLKEATTYLADEDDKKNGISYKDMVNEIMSVKDSDYSKNARNKFIIPAEPLGTIKVWYANENQIETDYNRLVEYAENHDPRQENPMLGVSSYDQTIGKTTKRVSEGYITLNGYAIVLIKDTDEDLVVDTMQDYYDEIADMTLEEFTKTFAANKEEFEEAFKRRNEEAKAEKKAAKDKEKELNKKRKSFEGLLTYENYISTRDLLNKEFVPVSPDEDSCYIAVYEHLNSKDELYKVVSISYKSYGIAGSKAFGANNPNYENDEKLCKIFILNLNDSEVAKKILNVKAIS